MTQEPQKHDAGGTAKATLPLDTIAFLVIMAFFIWAIYMAFQH